MNTVTILDALKEEARDRILDYLQEFPQWRTETDLLHYKMRLQDVEFGDANKRSSWEGVVEYIEFYLGEGKVEGSIEVMIDYVVTVEQNEFVEEAVTDLDYFNSAWRFIGFNVIWEEWDSLVEEVNELINN
jgi:hypothetical protein